MGWDCVPDPAGDVATDLAAHEAAPRGHSNVAQDVTRGSSPTQDATNVTGPAGGPNLVTPASTGTDFTHRGLSGGRIIEEYTSNAGNILPGGTPDSVDWVNDDHLSAASAASGVITITHDPSTDDDWYNGTYTCAVGTVRLPRYPGIYIASEAHIAAPDVASMGDTEGVGMILDPADPVDGAQYALIHLLKSGATLYLQSLYGRISTADTFNTILSGLAEAAFTTGYWVMMVANPDGSVDIGYYAGGSGSRPDISDYTWIANVADVLQVSDTNLSIGFKNQGDVTPPTGQRLVVTGWQVTYADRVSLV